MEKKQKGFLFEPMRKVQDETNKQDEEENELVQDKETEKQKFPDWYVSIA